MTLFYDPKSKKPRPWVYVIVILVPILLLVLGFVWGSGYVKKKNQDTQVEKKIDIFQSPVN